MDIGAPGTAARREGPWTVGRAAAVIGVAFLLWALGVLAIRLLGPTGALGNGWTPLVYGCVLAITIPGLWATRVLVGLPRVESAICAALIAATASTLDGVVVRWLPWVYASDPLTLAHAGAALQWAIGMLCAVGLAITASERRA